MEWLVAALTIIFGIVSIALWINYCSVGEETERQSSKDDTKARGPTSAGEGDIHRSGQVCTDPKCARKQEAGT